MKVHIGCGSVYLDGWLNVDLAGPKTFLAKDRPDLVEMYKTTDDNYYGRHQDKTMEKLRKGPVEKEYVCDAFGSFSDLPGQTWQIEEILARHSFEHLSISEAHRALDEIDRKMKPGGLLRLDVPDHEGTLKKFKETGDEFYIRHLLGPRRNDYGFHMMSYSPDRLQTLVEAHGFVYEGEEPNIHFYPAFCLRFRKPGPRPSYEYAKEFLSVVTPSMNVIEVGPGANPWYRANTFLDISQNRLDDIVKSGRAEGKEIDNCDIEQGTKYQDKEFDFLFASHVLEHANDPFKMAAEMSRIAKQGLIIVPSAFKEFLFNWEEMDHKWWFFNPEEEGGPLRIMSQDKAMMTRMNMTDYAKAACRIYRTGPNRLEEDQRITRKWFYKNEPNLDVIYPWKGEIKLRIVK